MTAGNVYWIDDYKSTGKPLGYIRMLRASDGVVARTATQLLYSTSTSTKPVGISWYNGMLYFADGTEGGE